MAAKINCIKRDVCIFAKESFCKSNSECGHYIMEKGFTSTNTQMASALWHELKRRQSNGLVPLRVDWVAVTEKRLNAAVAALRHL